MTNDDMIGDFLGWEESPAKAPRLEETPASQLEEIPHVPPQPRPDERPAPTFTIPQRPEPTIQTPDVPYEDIQAPIRISPVLPEHRLLDQLQEKYKDLFNGTITQVKDLDSEALLKIIHSMDEKIEMIKVQKQAVRITYEGKLKFDDEKKAKRLRETDSAFYIPRREKGAAKAAPSKATSEKQALNKFEAGIKQMVRLHMDEATIRATLTTMGTPIPANLTAIISQFLLTGK